MIAKSHSDIGRAPGLDETDHAKWSLHRARKTTGSRRRRLLWYSEANDNHWKEILGAATLSTLLGVGCELGAGANDNGIIRALRRGAGDSLNQIGQQAVRRNLNIQPTLTIRAGFLVELLSIVI